MRYLSILAAVIFTGGVAASECHPAFDEAKLLAAIGSKPEKMVKLKDDDLIRHQYSFRKEQTEDEVLGDKPSKYEPQIYVTLFQPPCSEKINIYFYVNEDGSMNEPNIKIASNAFGYLTGFSEGEFERNIKKLSGVNRFELNNDKANSLFVKIGDTYSINISLKQ